MRLIFLLLAVATAAPAFAQSVRPSSYVVADRMAIALAESSGDPAIVGDLEITRGGSIGLWQINLYWHPEYSKELLLNPEANAAAAYAIYANADHSFSPWSTYASGSYRRFLGVASEACA